MRVGNFCNAQLQLVASTKNGKNKVQRIHGKHIQVHQVLFPELLFELSLVDLYGFICVDT